MFIKKVFVYLLNNNRKQNIMKKLSLLIILFCAISCVKNPKLEKPFLVIRESFVYHGSFNTYYYVCQDKNGETLQFESIKDEYNVGDVIK